MMFSDDVILHRTRSSFFGAQKFVYNTTIDEKKYNENKIEFVRFCIVKSARNRK